jgi:hypothetical protein
MTFRTIFGVAVLLLLGAARTASAGIDNKTEPAPRFDPSAVVNFEATVLEVKTSAVVTLLVKTDTESSVDVYLGPVDFVKSFDITFRKGDRIHVAGSKVKSAGVTLVLAREVRKDSTTLYLRGKNGDPYW